MKFTGTIGAYLASVDNYDLRKFNDAVASGDGAELANGLAFSKHDMTKHGWCKIGTAEFTITLDSVNEVAANAIAALKKQQEEIRAEAHAKCNAIEATIQNMLALEAPAPIHGEVVEDTDFI